MTEEIKHINKKNQEYIAENNRMTKKIELTTEVLSCDYFNRNRGFNCYKGKNCTEELDCYYKQLKRLEQENEELKTWLESKEKQLKHLIEYNQNKKDQIKTLRFMLFDEKEIPKDKFTMMYRIAQNERRTRSHMDLCTNITKKYRSALEEIREVLKFYADSWVDEKIYPNLHYDNTKAKEGLSKINEVLQCE